MPGIISASDADYAFEIVKTICAEVGPGLPGSAQEQERAAVFKHELESHLGAEHVVVEEFTLAPGAFLNLYPGLFMLIAALLNISIGRFAGVSPWITTIAALALSILSPMLFVTEFYFGKELVDPFFKQKQSQNVIGTIRKPGTRNVKRLLILSGHHDSAPENNCLRLLSSVNRLLTPKDRGDSAREDARLRFLGILFYLISGTFFLGFVTVLVMSILQLAGVITGNPGIVRIGTLGWILLLYPMLPSIIFGLFSIKSGEKGGTVPGAVDNLSASALAVAMCRFLVNNPSYIPDDTEIRFISFGSEEAGLRGSRRYAARHLDELKRLDARLLNIEMVAHPEINILTADVNGTVKHAPEMVNSVVEAAKRAEIPYRVSTASIGVGTDAAPFTWAGLKATTLMPFKVPQQTVVFYHQKWDTLDQVTIEPLLNVLKLTMEWIRCGGE
jgi:hypothetical protein